MKKIILASALIFQNFIHAASLMLLNDSPFKLDAIIINALGDVKGNVSLDPTQQITWYSPTEGYVKYNSPTVPFTVVWYCKDGSEYGIWTNATSGSMVTAQNSTGQKMCKFKKPKEGEANTNIND